MGKAFKGDNGKQEKREVDLKGQGVPSTARQSGRLLVLKFMGCEEPDLSRIEYHGNLSPKFEYRQRGEDSLNSFKSTVTSKALSIFFLDHLCAQLRTPPKKYVMEGGNGTPAASLGNALAKSNGEWYALFKNFSDQGRERYCVADLFGGRNFEGKPDKHRVIYVQADYLPPDCMEVYWNDQKLEGLPEIQKLADQFRKAHELPPAIELDLPVREESPPPEPAPQAPSPTPEPKRPKAEQPTAEKPTSPPDVKEPKMDVAATLLGQFLAGVAKLVNPVKEAAEKASTKPNPTTTGGSSKPQEPAHRKPEEAPKPKDQPTKEAAPKPLKLPPSPPARIDPRLFEIQHPKGWSWDDQDGLLNFGDDNNEADVWRIRDASEGVLIFGGVGSGKTSGSGYTFATAFLNSGYGGLVMTAKPDEASRWLRLCEENGRKADCIHITPGSGHKLNLLQYESQRPGDRLTVTDDLIALLRCLIAAMSRSKREGIGNDFWTNATNQLMRMTFEVFLLSQEALTIDSLVRFINLAPLDVRKPWQDIPYFADLLARAEANSRNGSLTDQRIYAKVHEYWTTAFPKITDATRSGIVTGFTAMAEVLGGRGIHELISTDTNLTPEMILSGKIVILDFPLKESVQGGLMVQAAWKLLFQQAIERRTDKGQPEARPCFLWEDEGHLFFSQQDVDFQPTARDCRAAHVILSQNIHNFLHQGHDAHAVYAVFSAMNTNIFHTNGDLETNRWASERIGRIRTQKLTTSGNMVKPVQAQDYTIWQRRPEDNKTIGSFQWEKKEELALNPEDFSKLKRGGDGTCEGVILWLSHQFAINQQRNFCVKIFTQEPKPTSKY